ncbi:MAG: NAD(P)/FAD-dependent oxidoreductase [Micropruina sp.]|nr:NAD(P)/FAD-dependent oxidoreductase [Micropruina sp.]
MGDTRVIVVGAGHNGLTAATYLARAGVAVTLLERLPTVGGAAVSATAFPGVDAQLSRFSYLVSLMPKQIINDLGLDVRLIRRRYASYTPLPGGFQGLLVDHADPAGTAASFACVGAVADVRGFNAFYERTGRMARALFPTMTGPLPTESEVRGMIGASEWEDFVERPINEVIERSVSHDLVRGVVASDALIGTFAALDDPEREQNRCLLYHVIGGGTGHWDVPQGGMGAVTGGLKRVARAAGVEIVTNAEVTAITPDGEVTYREGDAEHRVRGDLVLAGVAPAVLATLTGSATSGQARPEGAQLKVNMLLRRLPRTRERTMKPEAAFGGTFHINETYTQLVSAREAALAGRVPDPLPCEIYCHSLADRTILGDGMGIDGFQTMTLFGLQVPDRLVDQLGNDVLREQAGAAALASLNSVLDEPIEPLLALDANGNPCLEVKTTRDVEHALNMPGGQIFHGPLSWPWLDDDAPRSTPAQRWGVDTEHDRILLCGSGSRRGGGVSGIGGHSAAMAALELIG